MTRNRSMDGFGGGSPAVQAECRSAGGKARPVKPLGRKAYGSIPHLPGSRMGPADHHCHEGQRVIACEKVRDRHDRVIVTEKLDGGNVAVAMVGGSPIALGRAGFPAITSPFVQHHHFDTWASRLRSLWSAMLDDGEVLHGEWLCQAHGTRYALAHGPFVAFDLTRQGKRLPHGEMQDRCALYGVTTAHVVSDGPALSVAEALNALGDLGHHGALEMVEGAVWRIERKGQFDFMAKYVRPDKVDGKYLPEMTGADPIWHWLPERGQ